MDILLEIHHYLMYLVMLYLFFTVIKTWVGWLGNKPYTSMDTKVMNVAKMVVNIEALIGIAITVWMLVEGLDPMWHHVIAMVVAVALFSIGAGRSKKATEDKKKHMLAGIFSAIAFVLMNAAIPWDRVIGG